MNLEPIFQRIYDLPIADSIRQSSNSFPTLESIHVLSLVLVFGTIAIVDLRLVGFGLHRRGAHRLIAELLPYTWVAFACAAVSGALLFSSNAVQYASNTQFQFKMALIVLAGCNMALFHMTIYRRIAQWDLAVPPPVAARLFGVLSLIIWTAVIVLGRWIGFTLSPF